MPIVPQKLLPHHREELAKSGLTAATIREASIRSETDPKKLAKILGWETFPAKCCPAIVFPFVDTVGRNGYARVKPDHPRQSDGRVVRYESPRSQPNQIYLPPGVPDVLADPTQALLFTEGEKKSLCVAQHDFPCIGLVGVYGWKAKDDEAFLPALDRTEWENRPVYILFDSDIATNGDVQAAESRLVAQLENRGARVKVCRIPERPAGTDGKPTKQGIDDYVVAQVAKGVDPKEAIRKLLDAAEQATNEVKFPAKNADAGREADSFLQAVGHDGLPTLRSWRGGWMRWSKGNYDLTPPSEARAALVRHLDKKFSRLSSHVIGNVLEVLRAKAMLAARIEPPAWIGDKPGPWPADEILAARNGLVHIPSFVAGQKNYIIPTTPRFFTTSALDYDFQVRALPPKTWITFLSQLWPDDSASINTLQEWMGYCLTPDTRQEKILLGVGPKRSGKGTIARVHRNLIGASNCCGPTLASLSQNFGLWPLLGKSLAIISDARLGGRMDSQIVVERLLSISGEDAITIDRKFLEPVTARLTTRLIIFSNELPRFGDSSGALAGRMILLRMTRSFFGQEDLDLGNKLRAELPEILLWAIEGWRRLRERGRFEQPKSGKEMLDSLEDLCSPISQFLREECLVNDGQRIARCNLYFSYVQWANGQGRKHIEDEAEFGRHLRAILPNLKDARFRVKGKVVRFYVGVGKGV